MPDRDSEREPRQISLLIGIGTYQAPFFLLPDGRRGRSTRLHGPANDVRLMQHALRRWGFESGDFQRILLDAEATKQNIADAFNWVAQTASKPDDVVVIYYSGHGSWAPDEAIDDVRARDETESWPYDQGLVPYDAVSPNDPRQLVLDDEISHWLGMDPRQRAVPGSERYPEALRRAAKIQTQNITLIFDACHSGAGSRSGDVFATEIRSRSATPPPHRQAPSAVEVADLNHVLVAATQPWQEAIERGIAELENRAYGVFTYHLSRALETIPTGSATFADLVRRVEIGLAPDAQRPHIGGNADALLFSDRVRTVDQPYSQANTRADGLLTLDTGAAHGVRLGAEYELYGDGEEDFRGTPLARLRVVDLDEFTATAEVIDHRSPPPSGRAALARLPGEAVTIDRLSVYLGDGATALRPTLESFTWLEETTSRERAHAIIQAIGDDSYRVLAGVRGDPMLHEVAPLFDEAGIDWAASSDSRDWRRASSFPADRICNPLRRAYALANLSRLEHQPVGLSVDISVLPYGAPPISRPDRSAQDTTRVGQSYNVWARVNVDDREALQELYSTEHGAIYLSVAVAGLASEPFRLFPTGTGFRRLAIDEIDTPIDLLGSPITMSPITGSEVIVAYAGTTPFEFGPLMDTLPRCDRLRTSRAHNPWGRGPAPTIDGWTTSSRIVRILPN